MVVRLFHPWVGGTERQAHKLTKELIAQGVTARVVTGLWFRGTPANEVIDGVPVSRNHTLWEFFGVRGLRKLGGYLYMLTLAWHLMATRKTYDIIHVHGLNYHTGVSSIVGRWLGKPVIVKLANSGMASDIDRMRRGQQLAGSKFLLPAALRCDRFVALSPLIAAELRAAGVDAGRILAIPNGVEIDDGAGPRERQAGVMPVVFVGRLHHQKGADILVDACRILTERSVPVSVRVVGDGPERPALEAQAVGDRLGGVLGFVGEVGDPRPELERAEVFVLPSRTEGMSNALLEAMAGGKAIVATAVSGSTELIEDGVNGLLVRPDDPEALADALEWLATHPEESRRLAAAAQAKARSGFSITGVASRYVDLYAELAGRSVKPSELVDLGKQGTGQ